MIESKTKAKITPEERKWWLSEIYSSFIDFAKIMGVFLVVVYLSIMLILWISKEPTDNLMQAAVIGFAVHFGVYVFFLVWPGIGVIIESLKVIKGDKIVLVGKPTKLYMTEGGSESLDHYYIVFDKTTFEITARQYDELQNATRVEVHYTPGNRRNRRVLRIFAV